MSEKSSSSPLARRSFLTRLSAGATAFGAAYAAGTPTATAQSLGGASWEPARHSEDDWMDAVPGVHRFILDNTSYEGFRDAMLYANNFIDVNQDAYGVENNDLAVLIVARHFSTPFSFNDAMWEKYGETLASRAGYNDPQSSAAPTTNPLGNSGANAPRGITLDSLFAKGLQLAVCQVATRAFAGFVAGAVGEDTEAIYDEITNNLVENANLTPAGIVAVNRAQERGYTFAYVG